MFSYNELSIRKIDSKDLEFLLYLRSKVWSNLGNIDFINDVEQEDWIRQTSKDKRKLYCILSNNEYGDIGIVRLDEIDYINRNMRVGGDILPEFQGQGYGKKMMSLIKKYCFDYLNMNRLWLMVLEGNKKAFYLYIKEGFIEEGRQRQAIYRNGMYQDYILMGLLRSEYVSKI